MNKRTLVGHVAKQLGVSSQTIHWYEVQGLIPPPERTEGGYRVYPDSTIEQLRFVRKALGIGFSVDEIRSIIEAKRQGNQPCEIVLSLLQKKIDDVNSQIETLTEVQEDLQCIQKRWLQTSSREQRNAALICPLIEEVDNSVEK